MRLLSTWLVLSSLVIACREPEHAGGASNVVRPECPPGAVLLHEGSELRCVRPDGTADGPFHSLWPDRILRREGLFRNGLREGPFRSFWRNGALQFESTYAQGVRVGSWRAFLPDGSPWVENDVRVGALPSSGATLTSTVIEKTDGVLGEESLPALRQLDEKAQRSGRVAIIVRLNQSVRPEGEWSEADRLRQRVKFRARKKSMLERLAGRGAKVLADYQIVPQMALEVDRETLVDLVLDPDIASVQENLPSRTASTAVDGTALTGAVATWTSGYTGAGTAIAILDSGVQANHPYLAGKVVSEACYSGASGMQGIVSVCPAGVTGSTAAGSGEPCGYVGCGHGTTVAGAAAGVNSGVGSSGIAPGASIISMQVFSYAPDTCIEANCLVSYASDQIAALEQVYLLSTSGQYRIAAANLSLGGTISSVHCDSDPLKPAIDNLGSIGVVTTAAAGNGGVVGAITRPGCISSAVSVGSSTLTDLISGMSSNAGILSLLAPGEFIQTSMAGGGYGLTSGTSIAAPAAAGAFAILREARPTASVSELLTALQSTGVPITDTRYGANIVKPRIQIDAALASFPSIRPQVSPNGGEFDQTISVTLSAPASGGSLYYTTDGSDPSVGHGQLLANPGTVTLSQSDTLSVVFVQSGLRASELVRASFTKIAHLGVTLQPAAAVVDDAAWRLVGGSTESFESGALHRFPWKTIGDSSWSVAQPSATASHAATSPTLSGGQSASLQLPLESDGGNITFSYRVSSELNFDCLLFLIDGVEQGRWSGDTGWQQASFSLSQGSHLLEWRYEKDAQDSAGADAAWIDDVTFPGDAWRQSGTELAPLAPGNYLLRFKPLTVWQAPVDRTVTVNDGVTQMVTATYVDNTGSLQVNLSPAAVVTAGADWRLDNGGWNSSGTTLTRIAAGSHIIQYKDVSGWATPPSTQISVPRNDTTVINTTYATPSVAVPELSPEGGVYTGPVHISLSAESGATIRYTLDGSAPSISSPVYVSPIVVGNESVVVVKAQSFRDGWLPSAIATATYSVTGQVSTPIITPEPGHHIAALQVQLATATSNAVIHFTTDGSTPDATSPVYSTPISLGLQTTTTIRAIAFRHEWAPSLIASGTFTITGTVARPELSPHPGGYALPQTVTLTTTTPGATIYYTTDGTLPTPASDRYGAPLSLGIGSTTVRAQAFLDGWEASAVADGTYVIAPAAEAPSVTPPPGTYTTAQRLVLTTSTPNAAIYFTTDGSDPARNSALYTGPIDLPLNSQLHLRARAFRNDLGPSALTVADYKVTGTLADISISPPPGVYASAQEIVLSTTTPGASIHCTTDGSVPDLHSPICSSPLALALGRRATVRAQAFLNEWIESQPLSATYTLFPDLSLASATGETLGTVNVPPGGTLSFRVVGGSDQVAVTEVGSSVAQGVLSQGTNGLLQYQASSTGAFAGDHVIEAVDSMTGHRAQFVVRVPMLLTVSSPGLLGGSTGSVRVAGAPANTVIHFGLFAADGTTPVDAAVAVIDSQATASADGADGNPAVAVLNAGLVASDTTVQIKASATGLPDADGAVQLTPSITYQGTVVDLAGWPIPGALVAVAPGTDRVSTGAGGAFSLRVAATQTTATVSAAGFQEKQLPSECLSAAGCVVRLDGETAQLSGEVVGLAANESALLSLSYLDVEGKTVTLDPESISGSGSGSDAFSFMLDRQTVWTVSVSGAGYEAAPSRVVSLTAGDVTGVRLALQPTAPTVMTQPAQADATDTVTLHVSLTTGQRSGELFFEHREGLDDWQQTPSLSYPAIPAELSATASVQLSCGRTHAYRAVAINDRGIRSEGEILEIAASPCPETAPIPVTKAKGCACASGSDAAAPLLLLLLIAFRRRRIGGGARALNLARRFAGTPMVVRLGLLLLSIHAGACAQRSEPIEQTVASRQAALKATASIFCVSVYFSHAWNDPPFDVGCSTNSPGPLMVTYQSGPATLNGTLVTPNDLGNVVLNVSVPETDFYEAASTTITLTMGPATPELEFPNPGTHFLSESSFKLQATSSPGSPPIQFARMGGPGAITNDEFFVRDLGQVTVRAYQQPNGYWEAASVTQDFLIDKGNPTFYLFDTAWNPFPSSLIYISGKTYGVYGYWGSPQSPKIGQASMSVLSGPATLQTGTLAPSGAGTIRIRATSAGNTWWNAGSQDFDIVVAPGSQEIIFPAIPDQIFGNGPITLTATAGSGLPVSYSATGSATVSGQVLTLTGAGTVSVTASQAGDTNWNPATSVTRTFNVMPTPPTITCASLTGHAWNDTPFDPACTSNSGAPVALAYLSGPATLSGTLVTPNDLGDVVLRASVAANGGYAAGTTTVTLTLGSATPALSFLNPGTHFVSEQKFKLQATSTPGSPSIQFVLMSGSGHIINDELFPHSTGVITVTAYQLNDAHWKYVAATQQFVVDEVSCASRTGHAWNDPPFDPACAASSGAAVTLTYLSGPASLSGSLLTPNDLGDVVLRADVAASGSYAGGWTTITIPIGAATPSLSFPNPGTRLLSEGRFKLQATSSAGSPPIQFVRMTGPGNVVNGEMVLQSPGLITVRAAQAGTDRWKFAYVDQQFMVTKGDPTFSLVDSSWDPFPSSISFTLYPLSIIALWGSSTVNNLGTATLSVVSGPAAFQSGGGLALSGVGTIRIRAAFTGDSSWNAASQDFDIVVTRGSQEITFDAMPDQTFGSGPISLTATASSDLPVSLTVTGPATLSGQTLTMTGPGTVSVTASQAGDTNWNPAVSVTRTFNVAPAPPTITCASLTDHAWNDAPFDPACISNSGAPVTLTYLSGPATLNGTLVTPNELGNVVLRANVAASGTYAAGTTTVTLSLGPAIPALNFPNPGTHLLSDERFKLQAMSSAGSPPIQFVRVSGPGGILGDDYFIDAPGTVAVVAWQMGNAHWNEARVEQQFTIEKGDPIFTLIDSSGNPLQSTIRYTPQFFSVIGLWGSASTKNRGKAALSVISGPGAYQFERLFLWGTGTVRIRASFEGNSSWNAGQHDFDITVTPGQQSITFPPISGRQYGDSTFALHATAESGLPIVYTATGPATVEGNVITLTGVGAVTVTARQAGNALYDPAAPVSQTFNVAPGTPTIVVQDPGDRRYGDPAFSPIASAQSGEPVSFQVVSGPATVSADEIATTGLGTVLMRASVAGNANWNPAATTFSFNVIKGKPRLVLAAVATQNFVAGNVPLVATSNNPAPITYAAVSGPITVTPGLATFTGEGTATVRVSQPEDALWLAASAEQSFSIAPGQVTFAVSGYQNPQPFQLAPLQLQVVGTGGRTGTLSVTSGPATLEGTKLTLTGTGTVELVVSDPGGPGVSPVQQSVSFRVVPGEQTISFPLAAQGRYGDAPLPLSATSDSGLSVSYTVSGPAQIAEGSLIYTGVGRVTVTASQRGNDRWDPAEDVSRTLVVGRGIDDITFPLTDQTYGTPFLLSATTRSGRDPSFHVLAGDVILMGATAVATGVRPAVIRAFLPENELWESAEGDASFLVKKAPLHIDFPSIATKSFTEGGFTLQATTTEGLPVSFVVESGSIQLSGAQVTFIGVGQARVTAIAAGNGTYTDADPVSQTFQITPGTQTILLAGLSDPQPFRASIPLRATATSGLPVTTTVLSGPATISGDNLIPSGLGQVKLSATQVGSANWLSASATMTIALIQGDQTITFDPLPDAPLRKNATIVLGATTSSGLPVSYSVSGPATLQGNTLQLMGLGTVTVTASQPGDALWLAATPVQRSFDVLKDVVPTASLSGNLLQNGWYSGTVAVTLSFPDPASALQYRFDAESEWTTYTTLFPVSGDGTHVIAFRAVNAAGTAGDEQTVSVGIDETPPLTTPQLTGTRGNDDWFVSAVSVAFDASDPVSGVATTSYRVGTAAWEVGTSPGPFVDDGVVQLSFQSTDHAGHIEPEQNLRLQIDTTPPRTMVQLTGMTGQDGWYIGPVTAAVVAEDATSGVRSTMMSLNGGAWSAFDASLVVTQPGKHQLRVRSEDIAGNKEVEQVIDVNVDPQPPTLSVELSGTKGTHDWYVGPVTVTIAATAGTSELRTIQHRVDGSDWSDDAGPFVIEIDGEHVIDLAVTNGASEKSEQQLRVLLDSTPPAVTAAVGSTTLASNGGAFTDVHLTYNITDAIDAHPLADISVTSNEPTIGGQPQWKVQDGRLLVRAEADPNGHDRLYSIVVTAVDAAGNRTQATKTVSVSVAPPVRQGCHSISVAGLLPMLVAIILRRRPSRSMVYRWRR